MKTEKHSIALIIYDESGENYLIVKRPFEPGNAYYKWGFPAASKTSLDESWEEVVYRAAKTKLGIEVEIVRMIGEDIADRGDYILRLRDYEVKIVSGTPSVPQPYEGVTQYEEIRYTNDPQDIMESAQKGSVCTRIFLEDIGIEWKS
jgi:8-oxo-dGTP diphosphatase